MDSELVDSKREVAPLEQTTEATGSFPVILVPLDGSTFAEWALPTAERLAHMHGSLLLLAHVTPLLTWAFSARDGFATPEMYDELLAAEDRDAHTYLAHIAAELAARGIHVQVLAVRGDPAATLIDVARQTPADLVVMSTHGRTGLERFALGSVADRLVREGTAPVLLLRALGTPASAPTPERGQRGETAESMRDGREVRLSRAHIPLDGSMLAERAFELAAKLAGAPLEDIVLERVVVAHDGSRVVDEARDYLVAARLRLITTFPPGVCTVSTRVLFGSAADAICDEARRDADLVIMATHGLTGTRRWMVGSVADRVLRATPVPMLLVRAFAPKPQPSSAFTTVTRAGETQ